jgi:hypothetical protein
VITAYGNARRVNLRKAGVTESGTTLVSAPSGSHIASHRIRGQEEHVTITTGAEHNGVSGMTFQFAGDQIASNNAASFTIDYDYIKHLVTVQHFDSALSDLT